MSNLSRRTGTEIRSQDSGELEARRCKIHGFTCGGRHVREASDLRVVLRSEEYPVARTNLPYQIRPLVPECLFYGLRLLHLCTFRRLQRFGTWFGAPYYRVQPGPGKVSCTVA